MAGGEEVRLGNKNRIVDMSTIKGGVRRDQLKNDAQRAIFDALNTVKGKSGEGDEMLDAREISAAIEMLLEEDKGDNKLAGSDIGRILDRLGLKGQKFNVDGKERKIKKEDLFEVIELLSQSSDAIESSEVVGEGAERTIKITYKDGNEERINADGTSELQDDSDGVRTIAYFDNKKNLTKTQIQTENATRVSLVKQVNDENLEYQVTTMSADGNNVDVVEYSDDKKPVSRHVVDKNKDTKSDIRYEDGVIAEVNVSIGNSTTIRDIYDEKGENVVMSVRTDEQGNGLKKTAETVYNSDGTFSETIYDQANNEEIVREGTIESNENGEFFLVKKEVTTSKNAVTTSNYNYDTGFKVEDTEFNNGNKSQTAYAMSVGENGIEYTRTQQVKVVNGRQYGVKYDNGNTVVVTQYGESIAKMAEAFGCTQQDLIDLNQDVIKTNKKGHRYFSTGQEVRVPGELEADDKKIASRDSSEVAIAKAKQAEIERQQRIAEQKAARAERQAAKTAQTRTAAINKQAEEARQVITKHKQDVKNAKNISNHLSAYLLGHWNAADDKEFLNLLRNNVNADNVVEVLIQYPEVFNKKRNKKESLIETIMNESGGHAEALDIIRLNLLRAATKAGVDEKTKNKLYNDYTYVGKDGKRYYISDKKKLVQTTNAFINQIVAAQHKNPKIMTYDEAQKILLDSENGLDASGYVQGAVQQYNDMSADYNWADKTGDWISGLFGCETIGQMNKKMSGLSNDMKLLVQYANGKDKAKFNAQYQKIFGVPFNPQVIAAREKAMDTYTTAAMHDATAKTFQSVVNHVKGHMGQNTVRFDNLCNDIATWCFGNKMNGKKVEQVITGKQLQQVAANYAKTHNMPFNSELDKRNALVAWAHEEQLDAAAKCNQTLGGKSFKQLEAEIDRCNKAAFGTKCNLIEEIEDFNNGVKTGGAMVEMGVEIAATIALSAIPGAGAALVGRLAAGTARLGSYGLRASRCLRTVQKGLKTVNTVVKGGRTTKAGTTVTTSVTSHMAANAAVGFVASSGVQLSNGDWDFERAATTAVFMGGGVGIARGADKLVGMSNISSKTGQALAGEGIRDVGNLGLVAVINGGEITDLDVAMTAGMEFLMGRFAGALNRVRAPKSAGKGYVADTPAPHDGGGALHVEGTPTPVTDKLATPAPKSTPLRETPVQPYADNSSVPVGDFGRQSRTGKPTEKVQAIEAEVKNVAEHSTSGVELATTRREVSSIANRDFRRQQLKKLDDAAAKLPADQQAAYRQQCAEFDRIDAENILNSRNSLVPEDCAVLERYITQNANNPEVLASIETRLNGKNFGGDAAIENLQRVQKHLNKVKADNAPAMTMDELSELVAQKKAAGKSFSETEVPEVVKLIENCTPEEFAKIDQMITGAVRKNPAVKKALKERAETIRQEKVQVAPDEARKSSVVEEQSAKTEDVAKADENANKEVKDREEGQRVNEKQAAKTDENANKEVKGREEEQPVNKEPAAAEEVQVSDDVVVERVNAAEEVPVSDEVVVEEVRATDAEQRLQELADDIDVNDMFEMEDRVARDPMGRSNVIEYDGRGPSGEIIYTENGVKYRIEYKQGEAVAMKIEGEGNALHFKFDENGNKVPVTSDEFIKLHGEATDAYLQVQETKGFRSVNLTTGETDVTEFRTNSKGETTLIIERTLDEYGNEIRTVHKDPKGKVKNISEIEYNADNKPIHVVFKNGKDKVIGSREFEYNAFGKETKMVSKDRKGNIKNIEEREYDAFGNERVYKDGKGNIERIIEREYDGFDNEIKIVYKDGKGNIERIIENEYDGLKLVRQVSIKIKEGKVASATLEYSADEFIAKPRDITAEYVSKHAQDIANQVSESEMTSQQKSTWQSFKTQLSNVGKMSVEELRTLGNKLVQFAKTQAKAVQAQIKPILDDLKALVKAKDIKSTMPKSEASLQHQPQAEFSERAQSLADSYVPARNAEELFNLAQHSDAFDITTSFQDGQGAIIFEKNGVRSQVHFEDGKPVALRLSEGENNKAYFRFDENGNKIKISRDEFLELKTRADEKFNDVYLARWNNSDPIIARGTNLSDHDFDVIKQIKKVYKLQDEANMVRALDEIMARIKNGEVPCREMFDNIVKQLGIPEKDLRLSLKYVEDFASIEQMFRKPRVKVEDDIAAGRGRGLDRFREKRELFPEDELQARQARKAEEARKVEEAREEASKIAEQKREEMRQRFEESEKKAEQEAMKQKQDQIAELRGEEFRDVDLSAIENLDNQIAVLQLMNEYKAANKPYSEMEILGDLNNRGIYNDPKFGQEFNVIRKTLYPKEARYAELQSTYNIIGRQTLEIRDEIIAQIKTMQEQGAPISPNVIDELINGHDFIYAHDVSYVYDNPLRKSIMQEPELKAYFDDNYFGLYDNPKYEFDVEYLPDAIESVNKIKQDIKSNKPITSESIQNAIDVVCKNNGTSPTTSTFGLVQDILRSDHSLQIPENQIKGILGNWYYPD